jgi:alkylhydroperoxidase family enzyme
MSTQRNPRIHPLDPATATGPVREIFDGVKAKTGMVPNLYRVMGHSPAALAAYLAINEKLEGSILGPAVREKVALAVSLTFSNYTNHLARTPLDFPPAPDLPAEG